MMRIGWTATLATFLLVLAGCRPAGPGRSESVPPSRPAAGPSGAAANEGRQAGPPAKERKRWTYTPKTSEGRVLGAIGRAAFHSVGGDTEP